MTCQTAARTLKRSIYLVALAGASTAACAQNLVYNGNFNTAGPDGWSVYNVPGTETPPPLFLQQYVPNGGWDGSGCIEVGQSQRSFTSLAYGGGTDFARFKADSNRAFRVNPDSYYRMTFDYATYNIGWDEGSQAVVQADLWNGQPKNGGSFVDSKHFNLHSTAGAWRTATFYFRPFRAGDRGFGGTNADFVQLKLGVVSSAGTARFDNMWVAEISQADYQANLPHKTFQPDNLPGRRGKAPSFTPSNVPTVRLHNGVWWFVKADGTPFWWRAVQGTTINASENPNMYFNLAAGYHGAGQTNHQYFVDAKRVLGNLGFNAESTLPDGSAQPRMANLGLNVSGYPDSVLLQDAGGAINTTRKPMPDPYNPVWQTYIRTHIRTYLAALGRIDEADFAGYFTDNEMHVEDLDKYIWSPYASQNFIQFMQARHGSIATVNARWTDGSIGRHFNMASFNDILAPGNKSRIRRWRPGVDPLGEDVEAFVKQMLKSYYHHICAVIREYEVERFGDWDSDGLADKRFIICTNRFDLAGFPNEFVPDLTRALDAIRELNASRPWFYFDVICANNYPGDELREGIKDYDNFWLLEGMAQRAGLPLMISEFGVHARDSGIKTGNNATRHSGWFVRSVDTDWDRAMVYDKMVRQWASSPYIIGAQWFKWANVLQNEGSPLTMPVNTEAAYYNGRNCGLVDTWNNLYPALAQQMQATHDYLDTAFRNGATFLRQHQPLRVKASSGFQEILVNYSTGITTQTPYQDADAYIWQGLPTGQFVGVYHYDYASGRFTQAAYRQKANI